MCVAEGNPITSAFPSLHRDLCLSCILYNAFQCWPCILSPCWSKIFWDVSIFFSLNLLHQIFFMWIFLRFKSQKFSFDMAVLATHLPNIPAASYNLFLYQGFLQERYALFRNLQLVSSVCLFLPLSSGYVFPFCILIKITDKNTPRIPFNLIMRVVCCFFLVV